MSTQTAVSVAVGALLAVTLIGSIGALWLSMRMNKTLREVIDEFDRSHARDAGEPSAQDVSDKTTTGTTQHDSGDGYGY